MSGQSRNKLSCSPLLIPALLIFAGASLPFALSDRILGEVQAQRTTGTKKPTAKPSPTPQTKPKSSTDVLGPPPPIPKLRQRQEQPPDLTPGEVISVDTTEVMLPVTVRDAGGRLVSNLARDDFRVYEDSSQQPLSDIALRQVPVDAILMVDSSSSVARNLDDFRRAAEGFAQRLAPDDRLALIKFDDRVELLQDWTKSRFQFKRALNRIEPGMFTAFNDALFLAAREQFSGGNTRHAAIVLSDGMDNGRGSTSLETALQALLKAQVTVYIVSNTEISRASKQSQLESLLAGSQASIKFNQVTIDELQLSIRGFNESEKRLEQIALATGGRLYKPLSFDGLDSIYAEVADELRLQYAIYYKPLNRTRDGSFRRVRVEMTNSSYGATTRVGYFAPK